MAKKPLCVAILWHMHQPDYGNRQTGDVYLPWTRFHAAKDYYDMGVLIEETPGLRVTINVVPSLLDQLAAYAAGSVHDTYAALTLKNASDLGEHDKSFLLRGFFQLPHHQMLLPYPRYAELLERRGLADDRGQYPAGLKRYTAPDYRDLQVWFNLAWCGPELRRHPEITALLKKGRRFSEEDKRRLLEAQRSLAGRVVPLYRHLTEVCGIEVSVSPYYHPILPLLCDVRSAREALPAIKLPEHSFSFPEDARRQVIEARGRYAELFGNPPRGLWPSEGSISDAVVSLARETGFRWLASDEVVLTNSLRKAGAILDNLPPERKFCAYQWQDDGPALFFRDHGLSDLIGFTYSRWKGEEAAADFANRLRQIHSCLPDDGRYYVVPVVLDGENAWEHFPDSGLVFLRTLYSLLTNSVDLQTVTFSDFLDLQPPTESLGTILTGSWIYGNLATWVGHPEKNRAWNHLAAARKFLAGYLDEHPDSGPAGEAAREMMIAEGSDWFWWYGDDHQSQNAAEFDALFRTHVKNVYRCVGHSYPLDLDLPIKSAAPEIKSRQPVHTITPCIDGAVTDYFEWLSAGFATPGGGESMHRISQHIDKVYFGFDRFNFYLRIDFSRPGRAPLPPRCSLQIQFLLPQRGLLTLERDEGKAWKCVAADGADVLQAEVGAGKILELAIPLAALGILQAQEAQLFISVLEAGRELERFPSIGFLRVQVNPWELDNQEWMV
jgi:alpha-amylase/alpha-mannosidase (GH57 family)